MGGIEPRIGADETAENPAIGAIITFVDDGGQLRDSYPILGIRRAATGQKIAALELSAPDGRIIALYRVGL